MTGRPPELPTLYNYRGFESMFTNIAWRHIVDFLWARAEQFGIGEDDPVLTQADYLSR